MNVDILLAFSTAVKSYSSMALGFHGLGENEMIIILHVNKGMICQP